MTYLAMNVENYDGIPMLKRIAQETARVKHGEAPLTRGAHT
jgi:hypothetical protein